MLRIHKIQEFNTRGETSGDVQGWIVGESMDREQQARSRETPVANISPKPCNVLQVNQVRLCVAVLKEGGGSYRV